MAGAGGGGGSGGAKVLGKLSVPGRPTELDKSRARAIALAVGSDGGCLDIFSPAYLFFLSLWETTRYRLKYCLKGPLNQKQPTNRSKLIIVTILVNLGVHKFMCMKYVQFIAMLCQECKWHYGTS